MKFSRIPATTVLMVLLGIVAPVFAAQDKPAQDQEHPKQENTRPQAKPAEPRSNAKPAETRQQARPTEQRPQTKPAEARTDARPNEQRPEAKTAQERSQARPAEARTEQKRPTPAQPRVQQQRTENVHTQRTANAQSHRTTVTNRQEHVRQQRTVTTQHRVVTEQFRQTTWQQHRATNWQADHRTWQQRGGYNGYRIPDDRFRGSFGEGHGFRMQGLPFLVVGGYPRFQYGGYWLSVVDPWPETWGANWYNTDDVYVVYADNGYYMYNRRYPGVGMAISISL